jgi:hypothetical protein
MAIVAADVKSFAPELSGLSDSVITTWIGFAPGAVAPSVMGTDADQATLLWVCHQCVRSANGASGTVGPVSRRDVGDVSISNGASDTASIIMGLRTTAYGVALMQLIRRRTAGGLVV